MEKITGHFADKMIDILDELEIDYELPSYDMCSFNNGEIQIVIWDVGGFYWCWVLDRVLEKELVEKMGYRSWHHICDTATRYKRICKTMDEVKEFIEKYYCGYVSIWEYSPQANKWTIFRSAYIDRDDAEWTANSLNKQRNEKGYRYQAFPCGIDPNK